MDIVAVVIYADESTNWLGEWDYILDPEAKAVAREGVEALRNRLHRRASAAEAA
jgi:hypothetical protein